MQYSSPRVRRVFLPVPLTRALASSFRRASFEFRRSPRQHRTERDSGAIRSFHPCDRDFYGRTGATRKRRETGTVRRREQNLECENSRSMNRSEARSSIVAIVVVRIQVRGGYISADVRSARS